MSIQASGLYMDGGEVDATLAHALPFRNPYSANQMRYLAVKKVAALATLAHFEVGRSLYFPNMENTQGL